MDTERVMIFIDGSNLYHNLKRLGHQRINFEKLIKLLLKERTLISTYYYAAPLDISIDSKKYWVQQKFFEHLKKIPNFKIILCKQKKRWDTNGLLRFDVKGDDVHLAVDLVSYAYENHYDTAIIVSGDEDFVPAVQRIQKLGKKVEDIYFYSSVSYSLKNICNFSYCINEINIEKIL
jgi:uncharacterized LabA/DUF88 family protein